jgi:hypothetical protein
MMLLSTVRFALVAALAVAGAALGPGCALAMRGRTQEVTIRASPADARITVDGKPVRAGPVRLERGRNHVVRVEAPGYRPGGAAINSHLTASFAVGDAVFAASGLLFFYVGAIVTCVPLVVDAATGAIDELEPRDVVVRLERAPPPQPPPPPALAQPPPPPPGTALAAYCARCGVPFEGAHHFCAWCGAARGPLARDAVPVAAPAPPPAEVAAPLAAYCPGCGLPFEPGHRYCPRCGEGRGQIAKPVSAPKER